MRAYDGDFQDDEVEAEQEDRFLARHVALAAPYDPDELDELPF